MPKIFIVDDDKDILVMVNSWSRNKDYDIITFSNADNLLMDVLQFKPDIVVLDIKLKGQDGRLICRALKASVPFPLKIILFSGDPIALLTYHEHYADGILNKPFEFEDLENKFKQHLGL
jgi:DNA-binding response OmpR family regulator